MGRAMKNIDKLLAMPFGCGEQNMILFAPNIFILNYLRSTGQLTQEIQDRATRFLKSGESGAFTAGAALSSETNSGGNLWFSTRSHPIQHIQITRVQKQQEFSFLILSYSMSITNKIIFHLFVCL